MWCLPIGQSEADVANGQTSLLSGEVSAHVICRHGDSPDLNAEESERYENLLFSSCDLGRVEEDGGSLPPTPNGSWTL